MSVCYTKTSKGQPCFGMHFTWINDIQSETKLVKPPRRQVGGRLHDNADAGEYRVGGGASFPLNNLISARHLRSV